MDKETKHIFDEAAKNLNASDIFAKETKKSVTAADVFGGDEKLINSLEKAHRNALLAQAANVGQAAANTASRLFSATNIILIINIMVITVIVLYLLLKSQPQLAPAGQLPQTGEIQLTDQLHNDIAKKLSITESEAKALDKSASWALAETYYNNTEYERAYYVFDKLAENLTTNIPADEFLKDFFHLKMALCLQNTDYQQDVSRLFTNALQSKSIVVKAMANYHLIFAQNHKKQFLKARTRAYQTIALLKAFEGNFSPNFEADCYFMIAEALTRQVMLIANEPEKLPGKLWSDTLKIENIPQMTQIQLRTFLQTGVYQIAEGAIVPKIEKQKNLSVGSRWSAIAKQAPLEEVLIRLASAANHNTIWQDSSESVRKKPLTIYLPATSQQFIAEVAAGSTGLIARTDGDDLVIYNPDSYDNLEKQKQLLVKEAVSLWRRFLIRYRGDHRTPNAHFALGLLQNYADQNVAALGEYKLVANGFSSNPLAPYALLNASKIKTNMQDYVGASEDLKEILINHPDTKIVDQAMLYLADATMQTGLYDSAINKYRRVYNLDLTHKTQKHAAYGLGECYYWTQNFPEAQRWLSLAITLTEDASDNRLYTAYYLIGKTFIHLEQYEKASQALRNALGGTIPMEDHVTITMDLVKAEINQENLLVALNIIEAIPTDRLAPEYASEVLIAKANIYCILGIPDTAASLLRHKIPFIVNSETRAKLNFQLAKCYIELDQLKLARKRVTDAIFNLPPGPLALEANLMIIDLSTRLNMLDEAKKICRQFLKNDLDTETRKKAGDLLGQIYDRQKLYANAANAYAGIIDVAGGSTK